MPTRSRFTRFPAIRRLARTPYGWALGAALGLAVVPLQSQAESEKEARYPYDPACPWGRLSNGKGMIHRCISEDEARRIASGQAVQSAPEAAKTPAPGVQSPEAGAPTETTTPSKTREYSLSVGPIVAEQGDITIGKLGAPVDKYRACVDDNGGLEAARAKVVISFLVQAARSRAEGVEVSKAAGISKKAAQCIADVVDRRRVGTPSEETTGANLTIEMISK